MVFVKSPNNETLILDLNPATTTLQALSLHIQRNHLIPIPQQRLYLSPRLLSTSGNGAVLLTHLGVYSNSILTLHVPLLGGMQATVAPKGRLEFLHAKPPQNYVADLGRGATGFTTRSDIGPARAAPDLPDRSATAIGDAAPPGVDRFFDSVSGLTVVDPKGYLTDLKSMKITNDAEVSDINKARLLLKSVMQSNPSYPHGWIAAARLEEVAGKIQAAQNLIRKGCEECPKSEDVWLEACRLASHGAEEVIARGVKSRVLREGLEHIPDSVRLWKAVVKLANKKDACLLLQRAVECCPLHVELWLALARQGTYENAEKVLNKARMKLSKEPAIWITAAKLEKANGNSDSLGKIIERVIKTLKIQGLKIDRAMWMKEAKAAERVEEKDRKRTSYAYKKSIWLKAAQLEKNHETREDLYALLRQGDMFLSRAKTSWLMDAKEKWLAGDVPAARGILQEAYATVPDSEEILLAAFKLEFENSEPERARRLLVKARESVGTEKVWMKSAIVERELGNMAEERSLLDEGLKRFPSFYKLWLMLGQLEERLGNLDQAKGVYELGLKHCSNCIPLWLSLAHLEEKVDGLSKARAVLTMARKRNPQNPELWLAAVRAEARHGFKKESEILMAEALQECPTSGILWAASIEMVPRPQQKTKSRDAYERCGDDPHVLAAVGKIYWHDRKFDESRSWFNRVVTLAPDIGDFWALYYKFEMQHGTEENQKDVLNRCIAAQPKLGEKWQVVSKAVENSHLPTEVILKKVVGAACSENGKN